MCGRLLVLNCHEAWIYQLRYLDQPLDIVVDLPGRHVRAWDAAMRPLPPKARTITLAEAAAQSDAYGCIIAHNPTDLLDTRAFNAPRLLVLHLTLEGMALEQGARTRLDEYRAAVAAYTAQLNTHVVAVSALKATSWGISSGVVPLSADVTDYPPWSGDFSGGLRI